MDSLDEMSVNANVMKELHADVSNIFQIGVNTTA